MIRHHYRVQDGDESAVSKNQGAVGHVAARAVDHPRDSLRATTSLIGLYIVIVVATIVALSVMSTMDSHLATPDAWVHAIIVAVFAAILSLRLRAANRGSRDAVRAISIIAGVLLAVNVIEAAIPGLFPTWMRIEMIGIATLMAATLASVITSRR